MRVDQNKSYDIEKRERERKKRLLFGSGSLEDGS
jgi:hypothetical protein